MLIFCPNCTAALPDRFLRQPQTQSTCPTCTTSLNIELFPALFRPRERIDPAALIAAEGEASCYEHASKRAVAVCNQCGRFVCALCEFSVDGKTWCPACLTPDQKGARIAALETGRTLFDSITLALAILPFLLFFYPSLITWPLVVYLTIRYWKKPSSIVPRNKWRFVVALLIMLAELAFFGLIIFLAVQQYGRTRPR